MHQGAGLAEAHPVSDLRIAELPGTRDPGRHANSTLAVESDASGVLLETSSQPEGGAVASSSAPRDSDDTTRFKRASSPWELAVPRWKMGALSFSHDLLVGGLSAAATKTVFAPLERVKLMLQTQHSMQQSRMSVMSTVVGIYRQQGILGFWKGNTAAVLRTLPTQAFNFAFWTSIKQSLPKGAGVSAPCAHHERLAVNVGAGALAGMCTTLIVYPLDFVRTQLAADLKDEFRGPIHCMRTMAGRHGVLSLYRGFGPSVQGIVVYRGVYFGLWDTLKPLLLEAPPGNKCTQQGPPAAAGSSGTTGGGLSVVLGLPHSQHTTVAMKWCIAQAVTLLAGLASYPFDTIRRRLMVQADRQPMLYRNAWDCWTKIARQEGLRGFYKGISLSLANWSGAAILLVVFDEVQSWPGVNGRN